MRAPRPAVPGDAVTALRRAVQLQPGSPDGWRLLADCLDAANDAAGADEARARYIKAAAHDPRLREAAAALAENNLPLADARLRAHLGAHPTDVTALRMLAEVAGRLRRYADAEELLERCLKLAPSFDAARHNYAVVLNRQMKPAEALPQVDLLLAKEPRNPAYSNLKAAILANLGDYSRLDRGLRERAAQLSGPAQDLDELRPRAEDGRPLRGQYRRVPPRDRPRALAGRGVLEPRQLEDVPLLACGYGRDAKRAARSGALAPTIGCISSSRSAKRSRTRARTRNRSRTTPRAMRPARSEHPYSADENTRFIARSKALYTPEFFAARKSAGAQAADPIFIVGLPRAGSTLLEQILASHSLVEGTIELPDMPQIARDLAGRDEPGSETRFFENVAALDAGEIKRLGERYLATTRAHRKTDAPFFVDKMPNNCSYIGLIRVLLPNAKIIDARRHPLGCCLSAFKQHFSRGQSFTYDLADLGRYYRDYVDLMAHIDAVLPGYVHRAFYERMIEDTESEVRRLLDYCGLPFEETCLRFYENERAVRTASSEQVRRPIFRDGMDHWRNFEPWLGPLKAALGPVLRCVSGRARRRCRIDGVLRRSI